MIDSRRKKQLFSRIDRFKTNWREVEFILWGVPIFLVLVSGLLIASTQRQLDDADWYLHWTTACLGIGIAFGLANSPLENFRKYLVPVYLITILSLIAVKLIGTSAFGAQRWLTIFGINIQPSEIAKLTSIFLLAEVLDRHQFKSLKDLLKPLLVIFIPWLLVFFQPDLGTSLVFGAVLLIMLYWSGMPLEWALLVLSGIITAILASIMPWLLIAWIPFLGLLAYRSLQQKKLFSFLAMGSHGLIACFTPWLWMNVLKEYQRERLTLFLDPGKDPLGGGYHLLQSQIGIGSGGIWGTGILQGKLTQLSFIPEQHTDFIFSALGEETGFLGTIIVITSFFFFIARLLKIARNARTNFESLFVVGVATMIMFQVMVNIFMTIGLGPVTGIPLPFMSYGRTALMVNFFALGFCLSVARRAQLISKN
tara:strand:+ start:9087 stop:10355 length:1269 start_codon:yes stop_codon:yes gene_type:complete